LPHAVLTLDTSQKYANRNLSTSSLLQWRHQQVAGAGVLLDGLPVHCGIDLLNSSPGSLALAVHLWPFR